MDHKVKIHSTHNNLDDAVEVAKQNGNDIYAGYKNCLADRKRQDKGNVDTYLVTESFDILYIFKFDGQKMLNKVTLGSSLSNSPLHLVLEQPDGSLSFFRDCLISKSDKANRRQACMLGYMLTEIRVA